MNIMQIYFSKEASNYNNRLHPAEILIQKDGTSKLIRRRDTLEDLLNNF